MRSFCITFALLALAACSNSTDTKAVTAPPATVVSPVRTLFDQATVAAGGGVLQYTKVGDALSGLTLTVPAGAYSASSVWTVGADSTVVVSIPAGFQQVGPVLTISNNQDYGALPSTIRIPMVIGAGNTVVPFYYNADTQKFEGIPTVDRSSTYLTLATENFSSALTATGAPTQTSVRSVSAIPNVQCGSGFGGVCILFMKISDDQLQGTFTSTFQAGRDNWEFVNYGDYANPSGDCEGMSITSMYYHYFVGGNTRLYHTYDSDLRNQWDNVQGIRFAGSVQRDYVDRLKAGFDQIDALNDMAGASATNNDALKALTSSWVVSTLKLTGRPVLMSIIGPAGQHTVVATAATQSGALTTVSFVDPNIPTATRTMKFTSGVLTPITVQENAKSSAGTFDRAYALGVTAEIPLKSIDARFVEFKAKTAGSDRYPNDYSWLAFNYFTRQYAVMPAVLQTTYNKFFPAILCPSCPLKVAGADLVDLQFAIPYDANGESAVETDSGEVTLKPGSNTFVLEGTAKSPYSKTGDIGFIDSRSVTVVYTPGTFALNVTTAPLNVIPGTSATDVILINRTNYLSPVGVTAVSDAGITVSTSSGPTRNDRVTLTVNVPNTVAVGTTHSVTVTAIGDDVLPVVTTFAVVVVGTPSYSMAVQTAPVYITSGSSSLPDNVTIARTNFSGAITLSYSAASGITLNFSTQPGTGSAGTFTVSVASNVQPGTYSVTLAGTSSLTQKTTTFAVVVSAIPGAGYSFAVLSDPFTVEINHTAYRYDVTLNRTQYNGDVAVGAAVDDSGIVVTPNPAPSTAGNTVAFALRAGASVSVGTHTLTLTGTAAGRTDLVTQFSVSTTLPVGGAPAGIVLLPIPVSVRLNTTQRFTAYLVDAAGNRTVAEAGWAIGINADNSNVAGDFTAPPFDAVQRWQTRDFSAAGVGSTPVRAYYYRTSNGQSTFLSVATFKVTP